MNFFELNASAQRRFERVFDLAAVAGTVQKRSGDTDEDKNP